MSFLGWVGAATLSVLGVLGPEGPARVVPPNFVDELVADIGTYAPTALAFTPDGRLLIASQNGLLRLYENGSLLPTPALTFSQICWGFEYGLLGVAVDPDFVANNYIYLYYTPYISGGGCTNRVSRFVLPSSNVVNLGSETILVDNIGAGIFHNGGDVQFGKDGCLYIAVGEAYQNPRLEHHLNGKILRITSSGGIPPDNPFQGLRTARCNVTGSTIPGYRCQETFAWGLRNPFRMAFDPNAATTVFRINDVGEHAYEEVNVGQAGADYGWPCREGAHGYGCDPPPPDMVDPIFEYAHNVNDCTAITGGAFVPNGLWPGYDGNYLFGDFTCGRIYSIPSTATFLGLGNLVTMTFGPHGNGRALYYTTKVLPGPAGQVRRIFYNVAGNNPPTAVGAGSLPGGPLPLAVTFDATGSSDPDGDPLTFFWDFGDGTPETSTTSLMIQHTYTTQGARSVTLRARDNNFAFSAPVMLTVYAGNNPPVPSISVPTPSQSFSVGEVVNLTGSATDAENGTLAADRLSWTVILHHNTHTHSFLGPVKGSAVPMTCPAPEDLLATDNSYLEIRLTATDLDGLSHTVGQSFQPLTMPITIQTSPASLTIRVNGIDFTGPSTFTSWANYVLNVNAPDQSQGGNNYTWVSWSDGGARAHAITTPATATTYTANFQVGPTGLKYFTLPPCRLVDTRLPNGPLGGPVLASGATRDFDLDGVCSVPVTAKALAVNVTVTQPTAPGDLRIHPQGTPQPNSSVINYGAGQARANNAVVGLSANGSISVFCGMAASGTTHFVLDVVGYFQE
jgi:glucose/arabinose dehydrogenase/PKD repeat protein